MRLGQEKQKAISLCKKQSFSNGVGYFLEVPLKNLNSLHYVEFPPKQNKFRFFLAELIFSGLFFD